MKKFLVAALYSLLFLLPIAARAELTLSGLTRESSGSENKVYGSLAFDSSYPTGGESLSLGSLPLRTVSNVIIEPSAGYVFTYDYTNNKILAYRASPAGSIAAPTFTGTSPISSLDLATPAFSGTGLTAAGQVITTTSTHTMTLNQCAGMWLLSATGATPPNLILSNTAVTGAAAVLTVKGAASTDAGAYTIVKALTPIGTNSAPAFTGTAAVLAEVSNTTDLAAVTGVRFTAFGKP